MDGGPDRRQLSDFFSHYPDRKTASTVRRSRLYWSAGLAVLLLAHGLWEFWNQSPPVWDMAYHQLQGWRVLKAWNQGQLVQNFADLSTYYPPLYYLQEALILGFFSATQWLAFFSNLPALLLLTGCTYRLAEELGDTSTAAAAGLLVLMFPMVAWLSRTTLLEVSLAGWVAAAGLCLVRSRHLTSRGWMALFAVVTVAGQLTKWTFALFLVFPVIYLTALSPDRKTSFRNLSDAALGAIPPLFLWYLPNLKNLLQRYQLTSQTGTGWEQDPQLGSLLGWIYYPRVLSSYYLFLPLSLLLIYSMYWSWCRFRCSRNSSISEEKPPHSGAKESSLRSPDRNPSPAEGRLSKTEQNTKVRGGAPSVRPAFLWAWLGGSMVLLTLLDAKDPRYLMPVVAPLSVLLVLPWSRRRAGLFLILSAAALQFVAVSFPILGVPEKIAFFSLQPARDFQSTRQEWVWFSTSYFGITGPPRRQDWKLDEIVDSIQGSKSVGFVPDAPFFHPAALELRAVEKGVELEVRRLGQFPFHPEQLRGLDQVIGKSGEQGISYITLYNRMVYQELERQDWRQVQSWELPDQSRAFLWRRPIPYR